MTKTWENIAGELWENYQSGKDANNGGLSVVKNKEYEGLLMGFYLNARVGVSPKDGKLVLVDVV